jgi:peptidyl-prolyl cis-trans isomerase B (cyclophilin B)
MAGKQQHQRKLARERYQRQAARQARRASLLQRWRVSLFAVVVVIAIIVGGVLLTNRPVGSTAAAKAPAVPKPPSEPAHHCNYTPSGVAARKVSFPPSTPAYKATFQATIRTNRGTIVINLLNSKATCTVNSFASLAMQHYFNNTPCQRLTTTDTYTLQCGDPTGTGRGGPGYKFDDENLPGAKYTAGTVAMVNKGPDTNGSQFFLVYKNSTLSASYTPFGIIVSGLKIIQEVAKAGSDNSTGQGDGRPKERVEIESVTIKKNVTDTS